MSTRSTIVTWYFEETPSEGGVYAQVRGDSSTERFRDIYRRCVLVFFTSAKLCNPHANLVLYTNKPWSAHASTVSQEVRAGLDRLGVEVRTIPYAFSPPESWRREWVNQFFVFDILQDLSLLVDDSELVLVLDSDVVWSDGASANLWRDLGTLGSLTYHPIVNLDEDINGLSQVEMTALSSLLLESNSEVVRYCGGEFIALRGDCLRLVSKKAVDLWDEIVLLHRRERFRSCEEAHLLSMALSDLSLNNGLGGRHVRRIWTSPLVFSDTSDDDLLLALWHVPSEKQYGLRRTYSRLIRTGILGSSQDLAKELGVGKTSLAKLGRDICYSLYLRIISKST